MNDDNSLKSFTKILTFGKELNDMFGNKHNNIHLYYKLLKKTPVSNKNAINKHNSIFENFYNENKNFVLNKSLKALVSDNISFSDKVYINIRQIMNDSDKETRETIFKHIQLISYLITKDQEIKSKLMGLSEMSLVQGLPGSGPGLTNTDEEEGNEKEFIDGFMNKIEDAFKDKNYDNPLSATMDLLQSGLFSDVVNTMSKDVSAGKLDINKLLGNVQGMVKSLSKDISPSMETMGLNPDILNGNIPEGMNFDPQQLFSNTQGGDMSGIFSMASNLMNGMTNGGGINLKQMMNSVSGLQGSNDIPNIEVTENTSDEDLLKLLKSSSLNPKK